MPDQPVNENQEPPESSEGPSKEEIKRAMKAFRKRLKLTILDDESRLGSRYTTGGRTSNIVAIIPPHQYPKEVWEALVEKGRLKNAGQGFYELVE